MIETSKVILGEFLEPVLCRKNGLYAFYGVLRAYSDLAWYGGGLGLDLR